MNLLNMAAEILGSKLSQSGNSSSASVLTSALKNLLPTGGDGDLDISDLVGLLNKGGLQTLVGSWLGDGKNSPISLSQIVSLLGQDKISQFAKTIGVNSDTATKGLSEMLPELIDKNSRGGNLLESVLKSGAAESLAKNVLGSLFK
jgi:uncharacterized protein YidB (DUF937 family)